MIYQNWAKYSLYLEKRHYWQADPYTLEEPYYDPEKMVMKRFVDIN